MDKATLKAIIQWDIKTWGRAIPYWEAAVDWQGVESCLELGGREGGLSLWTALKGKKTVCSDLEDVQLTAEKLHGGYQIGNLIRYEDIDATRIPYENEFDIILFKSIMGGIGRNGNIAQQQAAFDQIYKALKPGGSLLFAENLTGSWLHRQLRKLFVRWGGSWRYVSLGEMDAFLSKFSSYELKTTGVVAAFGQGEAQRNLLASLDEAVFNTLCPSSMHYICYGIATK